MPTKKELKDYCRKNKIKGYSRLNKTEIEELINSHKKHINQTEDFYERYKKSETKEERLLMKVKLQKSMIEKLKKLKQSQNIKPKK